jgi:hypothetical protein
MTITLDSATTATLLAWPSFHNGVRGTVLLASRELGIALTRPLRDACTTCERISAR